MASSSTPVHPARYLVLFLVLLIGAYLLVFLTEERDAVGWDLTSGYSTFTNRWIVVIVFKF